MPSSNDRSQDVSQSGHQFPRRDAQLKRLAGLHGSLRIEDCPTVRGAIITIDRRGVKRRIYATGQWRPVGDEVIG